MNVDEPLVEEVATGVALFTDDRIAHPEVLSFLIENIIDLDVVPTFSSNRMHLVNQHSVDHQFLV